MTETAAKTRLFVDADLGPGVEINLSRDQAHYVFDVMRLGAGDVAGLFNGRDGEWRAEVTATGKRRGALTCQAQSRAQETPPDLWLLFAPIKKARTDFIVEKAAEMGCRRIMPVFTQRTQSGRVNTERLLAHAIEAAEQCGLVSVPVVAQAAKLDAVLASWPAERQLMFCDESGEADTALTALSAAPDGPWAVLIGPDGGFAPEEAARLRALPSVTPVTLGPRILRADTAAVAALTAWQATLGDWR
jgi:16S rRNA (uracil1498-N3)-methyltransferase